MLIFHFYIFFGELSVKVFDRYIFFGEVSIKVFDLFLNLTVFTDLMWSRTTHPPALIADSAINSRLRRRVPQNPRWYKTYV